MRIDEATISYYSIIWFACNSAGRILLANSEEGRLPSFVAEDQERAQLLANELCGLQAIARERKPPLDYALLSDRGFYCFEGDTFDGDLYRLRAIPKNPLHLDDLDETVRLLLHKQQLLPDLVKCDHFYIPEKG